MDNTTWQWQIHPGATVYFADGAPVGTVRAAHASYVVVVTHVVVTRGLFFPTDCYVPTSAIATIAGDDVYLGVTKDEARTSGWYS